jgi:hypothetical protein
MVRAVARTRLLLALVAVGVVLYCGAAVIGAFAVAALLQILLGP